MSESKADGDQATAQKKQKKKLKRPKITRSMTAKVGRRTVTLSDKELQVLINDVKGIEWDEIDVNLTLLYPKDLQLLLEHINVDDAEVRCGAYRHADYCSLTHAARFLLCTVDARR